MPNEPEITMNQVCSISIAFPVEDDNEAIQLKKKIEQALKDNPEARVDFRITKMPNRQPPPVR